MTLEKNDQVIHSVQKVNIGSRFLNSIIQNKPTEWHFFRNSRKGSVNSKILYPAKLSQNIKVIINVT